MKKYPINSYVKVLECACSLMGRDHHVGMTGHILSIRRDGGYNLLLTNHQKVPAITVELITRAYTPRKRREKTWFEIFAESLFWQVGMRGI